MNLEPPRGGRLIALGAVIALDDDRGGGLRRRHEDAALSDHDEDVLGRDALTSHADLAMGAERDRTGRDVDGEREARLLRRRHAWCAWNLDPHPPLCPGLVRFHSWHLASSLIRAEEKAPKPIGERCGDAHHTPRRGVGLPFLGRHDVHVRSTRAWSFFDGERLRSCSIRHLGAPLRGMRRRPSDPAHGDRCLGADVRERNKVVFFAGPGVVGIQAVIPAKTRTSRALPRQKAGDGKLQGIFPSKRNGPHVRGGARLRDDPRFS